MAWQGIESNEFGTDEFLKWCDIVGTEPYFCLNFGTGTLDEGKQIPFPYYPYPVLRIPYPPTAMAWVEYCNGTKDTHYTNLRRKNGHPEPYNVKYWALGNEVYGPWQICQSTKEDYAKKAYQWAKALKLLDPSLILILCGENGFSPWDSYVTRKCIRPHQSGLSGTATTSLIDMHSIHLYTSSNDHVQNTTAPLAAERAIQIAVAMIDQARIENKVPASVPKQKICFDEWNVWDVYRSPGELGAEEKYTLSDALAVAVWLNVFVRQSKHIGMANIAQSVNVISPLMTTPEGVVKQATWWPLLLFSKYMRGSTLAVHLRCAEYEGETKPGWIRGTVDTPWLDVSAALSDDGVISLAVVNVHPERDAEVLLQGPRSIGIGVKVYTVTGEGVGATNMDGEDGVVVRESRWDAKGPYTFPRHSLTMLRWPVMSPGP